MQEIKSYNDCYREYHREVVKTNRCQRMDLQHLDLDICFTPNLGGPTTRMLTKSQGQSLCCVAWTLVPAVGSAEVCQAQNPCQRCT